MAFVAVGKERLGRFGGDVDARTHTSAARDGEGRKSIKGLDVEMKLMNDDQ